MAKREVIFRWLIQMIIAALFMAYAIWQDRQLLLMVIVLPIFAIMWTAVSFVLLPRVENFLVEALGAAAGSFFTFALFGSIGVAGVWIWGSAIAYWLCWWSLLWWISKAAWIAVEGWRGRR